MPTVTLEPFDREYLERSWHWLRDPDVKRMTMAGDFTREDQERFYASLPGRQDYRLWGVAADGQPVGVAGLKNITEQEGEFFCYIGERDWWGRGIGPQMSELCDEQAKRLGLNRLVMVALVDNEQSIRAFRRCGYEPLAGGRADGTITLEKFLQP